MQNQVNTSPITQFIQIVRAAELANAKEVKIPMQQARLMNYALAEILEKLSQDYQTLFDSLKESSASTSSTTVLLDGGSWGST